MDKKITWSKSADKYFWNAFEWHYDNVSDDYAMQLADTVQSWLRKLASGRTIGRKTPKDPKLFQANVGYGYFVVFEYKPYGIHIVKMRHHKQEPD